MANFASVGRSIQLIRGLDGRFLALSLRAATLALSVVSVGVVAPFLGMHDLGSFAVIQALMAWTALSAMGLIEACSGILSRYRARGMLRGGKAYLDVAVTAVTAVAVGTGALLLIGAGLAIHQGWLAQNVALPLAIATSCALFSTPFTLIQASLNAEGAVQRNTAWAFLTSAVNLAALALIVRISIPAEWRLLAVAAVSGSSLLIVRAVTYFHESRRIYGTAAQHAGSPWRRSRHLRQASWPFVIISLAALSATQIDRVVAYTLLSAAEAARLDTLLKVFLALHTLYAVVIVKLWHTVGHPWNRGDGRQARCAMMKAVRDAAVYWLIVGGTLALCIDPVVSIFTRGTVVIEDVPLVTAVVMYLATRSIVDAVSISIFAIRRQRLTVTTVIAHGIVNIPCSLVGGIAFGLTGIIIGQWLALLLTSGWRFPLLFWRATKELGA